MATTEAIFMTMFGTMLFLGLFLLVAVWRAGGCLLRIEARIAERINSADFAQIPGLPDPGPSRREAAAPTDGAFAEFLAEDSDRRKMAKREQSEAYRKWRKDRGLNWPVS